MYRYKNEIFEAIRKIKTQEEEFEFFKNLDLKSASSLKTELGWGILHVACNHGKVTLTGLLLSTFFLEVNLKDIYDQTPLHLVCFWGDLNILEKFLENPLCDPNVKDIAGWTPIMMAANKNHFELVKAMLRSNRLVDVDCTITQDDGSLMKGTGLKEILHAKKRMESLVLNYKEDRIRTVRELRADFISQQPESIRQLLTNSCSNLTKTFLFLCADGHLEECKRQVLETDERSRFSLFNNKIILQSPLAVAIMRKHLHMVEYILTSPYFLKDKQRSIRENFLRLAKSPESKIVDCINRCWIE